MTEYIEPDDVDELVEVEGFHYRDRGLLLSALAAPMPVFGEEVYPGVHQKAAVLISAINRDHPVVDGTKRLSWFITVAFYAINGFNLRAGDVDDADRFIRRIAAGEVPVSDIELWLDEHTSRYEEVRGSTHHPLSAVRYGVRCEFSQPPDSGLT